jgi:methylglutaconyl-CoA hydratase
MKYQYLNIQMFDEGMVLVTLNRPKKRNALNIALLEELDSAFQEIQKYQMHRIVILTAVGEIFSSGLDLLEAANPTLIEKTSSAVAAVLTTIYTSPLVTIAAVQGDAIAGGAGLVAACDLAVMGADVKIGFPESRRGIVAAQVATLLCRQMSMRHVRELVLTGELISSKRAYEIGLINRIAPKGEILNESKLIAKQILKGAPQATKMTKYLLHCLDGTSFDKDLKTAIAIHHCARHSEEAKEGIEAFLEKRPPQWKKVSADSS